MTVLKLVTALDDFKALLTPTQHYVFKDHDPNDTVQLMKDLSESLFHYDGLGISANQLGLPWSVFAIRGEPWVIFNPRIVMHGTGQVKLEEACLSFPGMILPIKRSKEVRVRFSNLKTGEMESHTYTGMTARIFQHEINHLEGKMWFDGIGRIHLERAIRQANHKGFDYSKLGLMKFAKRFSH